MARVVVPLTDTERQQLDELATRSGVTARRWVQRAIARAWARSLLIPAFKGPVKASPRPKGPAKAKRR